MGVMWAHNYFEQATTSDALYVKSCGYFYDITHISTERLQGRKDYQLICVTDGRLWVKQGEDVQLLERGTVVLFKPDEPQIYGNFAQEKTSYFWVHFSGTAAKELLESCGLYNTRYSKTTAIDEGIYLIRKMIAAINRRPPQCQMRLLAYFADLLARITSPHDSGRAQPLYAKLSPALTAMEQEISKNYTVEEYAAMCSMSAHYFTHCFKEYTGRSPVQYRDAIAMDHAEFLLEHTTLPIGEIARMVGVSDPLYFSKKFKKYTGASPAAYRKNM